MDGSTIVGKDQVLIMSSTAKCFSEFKYSSDDPLLHGVDVLTESEPSSGQAHYRHLLSDKVRITPELFPGLASSLRGVGQAIGLDEDIRSFVYADPSIQAMCITHHDDGKRYFIVLFSSGIIEKLNSNELRFVIGHEVGHFLCKHWRYPKEASVQTQAERIAVMQLSQCAEISADRIGLLASGSLQSACSALLKSAAGLGEPYLKPNITSFLNQFRDLVEKDGNEASVLFSHPIIPLRIRSLLRFDPLARLIGAGKEVIAEQLIQVDRAIHEDFRRSHGNVLERMEQELMVKAKSWGMLWLFISDGVLTKEKQAILQQLNGREKTDQIIQYLRNNAENLKTELFKKMEKYCSEVKIMPQGKRVAFIDDLQSLSKGLIESSDAYERALADIRKILDL